MIYLGRLGNNHVIVENEKIIINVAKAAVEEKYERELIYRCQKKNRSMKMVTKKATEEAILGGRMHRVN